MPKTDRPNILLIISDQHAPHVTGCYGAGFVHTPNLDALAAEGVTFDNAYCNHPHCVPSRAALMTGLETHRIPCFDFHSDYRSGLPTWAHMLTRAGYRTHLNGKMHFIGPDQLHGFQTHTNYNPEPVGGFRWGEEQPDPALGLVYWRDLHFEGSPRHEKRMAQEADKLADAAAFFNDAKDLDQPWSMTVGFFGPHYPQICTRAMFDRYADTDIPTPRPGDTLHPRNQHWHRCWGFDRFTQRDTMQGRQAYLAMVSHLDDWVGRVLQMLDDTGQADNTLVVYTSDHGEMWGEHGLWGKQCFYEESARVPLIVKGPALGIQQGTRLATPVTLLDLYPTFRDWAGGGDWDVPLDGRSLAGALRGDDLPSRPVFCEYYGPDTRGPERMVRHDHLKLNYYHHQGTELFDLDHDPGEMHNLADDPAYADDRDRLMGLLTDGWDADALDAAVRTEQNRRVLLSEGLSQP